MSWTNDAKSGEFASKPLHGHFAFVFDPQRMSLATTGASTERIDLDGRTLAEVQAWIADCLQRMGGPTPSKPIPDPKEWPDHPVARGAPFDTSDANAFEELAKHFGNAALALQIVAVREPHATPVRTWPHHFDMAALVSLDPERDPETARSVNVGFSPGDGQFAHPYWYVVPFPDPKKTDLPVLPGDGYWFREGWTGAILETPSYAGVESAGEQRGRVERFLDAAYHACRNLLEEGASG